MSLSPKSMLVAMIGMLGAAVAVEAHAAACKDVDIKVQNDGASDVLALSIEYRTVQDGTWRTEAFNNTEVSAGSLTTVASNQELQYIEGHDMKDIKLHYKVRCGGKWSVEKTFTDSSFTSPQCNSSSGKSYRVDLPASAVSCN